MSYTGLKWLKFKFILHPSEFVNIFHDIEYFIAITNQRVEADYKIEDKTSIFKQYELYYNKIISGNEWKKEEWKLDIHTQITDKPQYIRYEIFEIKENNQHKKFKRAIQIEPVINISSFALRVDHKQQLRVNLFDGKLNSHIGLEFSYPKEIWQNNETIKTGNLSTYNLYVELIKRIKKYTHKAKAVRNGINSSPDFWISEKCLPEINNNFGLKENAIILT
ncbi:hypothetical protein [Polluticaenibacter yanchengensis]|uniref:Uncharacterized protein n=1 Tax=Polluticaenibacter yanchengensis TaxID=3014562 RepID=A0ABT4UNS8_9BACT|nr:hypothetical protein [Chitinophagaceae bacterium LY-5]